MGSALLYLSLEEAMWKIPAICGKRYAFGATLVIYAISKCCEELRGANYNMSIIR